MTRKESESKEAKRRDETRKRYRTKIAKWKAEIRRLKMVGKRLREEVLAEEKARNGRAARRLGEFVDAYKRIEAGDATSALVDPRLSVALAVIDERARAALEAYRAILGRLLLSIPGVVRGGKT